MVAMADSILAEVEQSVKKGVKRVFIAENTQLQLRRTFAEA